jgi:hypothetical protein
MEIKDVITFDTLRVDLILSKGYLVSRKLNAETEKESF